MSDHAHHAVALGSSLGFGVGGMSLAMEMLYGAGSIAFKVITAIIITAASTATGVLVSRYMSHRLTPLPPAPKP